MQVRDPVCHQAEPVYKNPSCPHPLPLTPTVDCQLLASSRPHKHVMRQSQPCGCEKSGTEPARKMHFFSSLICIWLCSVLAACRSFSCSVWTLLLDVGSSPPTRDQTKAPDWEHGVPATGPPGKSQEQCFLSFCLSLVESLVGRLALVQVPLA